MRLHVLAAALLIAVPGPALAQHEHSPYAGMETAQGTTLTPEEIRQLRAGEGMRLALPAELNQHPGPRHVLDLADDLRLEPDQVERVQAIFDAMSADAVQKGEEIISVEGHLAAAFRSASTGPSEVERITAHLGTLRGELQAIHLVAHLATRAALTEEQILRYDELRGYGGVG